MKRCEDHRCVVFGSPWPGVFGTRIDSERHYARHWHATYGFGVLEHGAQRSASGRGSVDAYAGDLITTNPGEVHDGRPLGSPARCWRIVYLDPGALARVAGEAASGIEITRPVLRDPLLQNGLRRLLARLEDWGHGSRSCADRLACEEALVETCGLLLDRHSNAAPMREAAADVAQVRSRLADDPLDAPSL